MPVRVAQAGHALAAEIDEREDDRRTFNSSPAEPSTAGSCNSEWGGKGRPD